MKNGEKFPPKPKDGTLQSDKPEPEANWFGVSTEPQEEFIGEGIRSHPQEIRTKDNKSIKDQQSKETPRRP